MEDCVLKHITATVLLALCTCSVAAEDIDLQRLVSEAFAALESEVQNRWQFAETSDDGEFTRFARYNPRAPEGETWQLLSVNDRQATVDEVTAFRQQKREQKEREAQRGGGSEVNPLDTIDLQSLRLLDENATSWRLGFTPIGSGDGQKMMAKMLGTLGISKSALCVEYLEIASPGPVKPQLGVKVEHFLSRFEFAPAKGSQSENGRCGRLLPTAMQFEINMRAFGVMNIDRAISAQYSDYRLISEF